jgi:hypothetical protein
MNPTLLQKVLTQLIGSARAHVGVSKTVKLGSLHVQVRARRNGNNWLCLYHRRRYPHPEFNTVLAAWAAIEPLPGPGTHRLEIVESRDGIFYCLAAEWRPELRVTQLDFFLPSSPSASSAKETA